MALFEVPTPTRECLVPITAPVRAAVAESGIRTGLCTVFVPHTTAGITLNENADPDVARDVVDFLARTVPRDPAFRHVEGNSDAHIKAIAVGSSVQFPVIDGRPALGTWQGVFLAEFDGPRVRKVRVVVQTAAA